MNKYLNIQAQLLSEYAQIQRKMDKLYASLQIQPSPLAVDVDMDDEKQLLEPLKISRKTQHKNIQLYQMKLNIYVSYQRLIALRNFRTLNQIGFKFDKNPKAVQQLTSPTGPPALSARARWCASKSVRGQGEAADGQREQPQQPRAP